MKADSPGVVILDTNVWISAFLLPESTTGQAVKKAVSTAVVVFSDPTFLELESRLWTRLWAKDALLISGDQDLLVLRQVPGVRIGTPAAYLRQ